MKVSNLSRFLRTARLFGGVQRVACVVGYVAVGMIGSVVYGGDLCLELYVTPDDALDIALDGDIAYVACGGAGLQIVDLSDPENPVLLGVYPTSNGTMSVDVVGTVAFIADGHNGLRCLDVSDPASPVLLGTLDFPNFVSEVIVRDGYAYVTDGLINGGLRIVDVQNLASPVLVGSLITDGNAVSMRLEGSLMYLADGSGGLKIIDVSDPEVPELVTDLPNRGGGWTTSVEVNGGYAYVFENSSLVIYDVSDPSNPVELIQMPLGVDVSDIKIFGSGLWTLELGFPGELRSYSMFSATELWANESHLLSGTPTKMMFGTDRLYVLQTEFPIVDQPPDQWNGISGVNTIADIECFACPADLTLDGILNFSDVSVFVALFGSSQPAADFTQDGVINFLDVSAFVAAFVAGCP